MQVYIFIDLDDTIFQTQRKCQGAMPLHAAAHGRDGSPLSFMTEKQRALLGFLGRDAHLVPTTARNYDAFSRVALSFNSMAILDFGGVILDEVGRVDPYWDNEIRTQISLAREPLRQIHCAIIDTAEQAGLRVRSRIINDFDMDLYVVTKLVDVTSDDLSLLNDLIVGHFDNESFYVHFNDNNLAVIPRCLNKRYAVQYLIDNKLRRTDSEVLTIGMGDSESDIDFMAACDYCLTPRSSQIARVLMEAYHV
jgi:hydroxymethylpyrimidine pyrophosphatase-like HAD family hydrolase